MFGTIFFTALRHSGFVAAIDRSLLVEACTAPVLVGLCALLPRHAREHAEPGAAVREPAAGGRPAVSGDGRLGVDHRDADGGDDERPAYIAPSAVRAS